MRRLHALLIAGLMAAPLSAVAAPNNDNDTNSDDSSQSEDSAPQTQTFEWSTVTGRARLGVMVMGLTPELREHFGAPADKGVIIARVEPKSAAAAAGLAVGDIVTDVKGESIDSAGDVLSALSDAKKNESVPLIVIRDHKSLTLSAKMLNDPGPAMMNQPRMPDWVKEMFENGPDSWTPPHRGFKSRSKT
ncbi:MAG: PDZ domain-containing protein [Kofleriaceae bacterium]|nr:PDZ domain-containing protein [Kofleriaceae bacterium]